MPWSNNHHRSPIGIDVGTRRFKALQLDQAGTRMLAAAMPPRAEAGSVPTREEVGRLAEVLFRGGFEGSRIVLAVPSDKVLTSVLELPRSAGVSLEQLARMEVARSHRCAPEALEMGWWELPAPSRAGKSAQVMVAACRHEDATPLLDSFESQGLDVVALDIRSCALARASGAGSPNPSASPPSGVLAVLDLGWSAATLVLLYRQTIVYERKVIDGGLSRLHAQLCKRLHIEGDVADYLLTEIGSGEQPTDMIPKDAPAILTDHIDALCSELSASFIYAGHQYQDAPVSSLVLAGSGAAIPGIEKLLKLHLGIDVRAIAPAALVSCPPELETSGKSSSLVTALGLAMFPLAGASEAFRPLAA